MSERPPAPAAPDNSPRTRSRRVLHRLEALGVFVAVTVLLLMVAKYFVLDHEVASRTGCPAAVRPLFRAAYWAALLLPLAAAFGPAVSVARGRPWTRTAVETAVGAGLFVGLMVGTELLRRSLCGG